MMNLDKKFENRKIVYDKLITYGFKKENDTFTFSKNILDNHFTINIVIDKSYNLMVIDNDTEDEYLPVYISDSKGEFVGKIKDECDRLIKDIITRCTVIDMFKNKNSLEIISYIKERYNSDLEFLWEKLPNCAIARNSNNDKWYAVFMRGKGSMLLLDDEQIEIINLRYSKDKINDIIDNKIIFPGYHMNKKSWISIKIDDIELSKLKDLVDNSYNLINSNKTGLKTEDMAIRIYDYLKKIPKGKVVTYGQIAEYLGNKGLSRVVGTILRKGIKDDVPYYKVLNSSGNLVKTKYKGLQKKLLEDEGIVVINDKVDLNKYKWSD